MRLGVISSTRDGVFIPIIRDAFKESEHPRGQPENAGEFAKGGTTSLPLEKTEVIRDVPCPWEQDPIDVVVNPTRLHLMRMFDADSKDLRVTKMVDFDKAVVRMISDGTNVAIAAGHTAAHTYIGGILIDTAHPTMTLEGDHRMEDMWILVQETAPYYTGLQKPIKYPTYTLGDRQVKVTQLIETKAGPEKWIHPKPEKWPLGLRRAFGLTTKDERRAMVFDSRYQVRDARGVIARFVRDWNEQEHPRGQPENAGEFTSSGGMRRAHRVNDQWIDDQGETVPAHIQKMKIPPAWKDVTFSADPKTAIQVKGVDAAGRTQRVYSPEHSSKQAAAKFARIKELEKKFEHIKTQNDAMRMDHDPRVRDAADATMLIMAMGVRPGSEADTKAKVKGYGATTLLGQHVVTTGNGLTLRFVPGKHHGEPVELPVTDREVAKMLVARSKRAGPTGKLFPNLDERALLDHVHNFNGGGFKTKDLRTLLACRTAMTEMKSIPTPKTVTDYKKAVLAVARRVAAKLGNTHTVALQSYINPAVFAPWQEAAKV